MKSKFQAHCYYEPYLGIIFLSSTLFSSLFLVSLSNTRNFESYKCSKIPNVTISNNLDELHKTLLLNIQNSKKQVHFCFSTLNETLFKESYIPALKIAKNNGAKITIFTSINDNIEQDLILCGFDNVFDLNKAKIAITSQSVITDDKVFFAPFILPNSNADIQHHGQLIEINDCDAMHEDVLSFVNFYEFSEKSELPTVISSSLTSKTSAINPIKVDDSKAFLFNSPYLTMIPLKVDSNTIFSKLFNTDPLFIDIYSYSPICLNIFTDESDFSMYKALKELLFRNKTKVRYLSSTRSNEDKTSSCFESLGAFSKLFLKTYEESYEGASFILVRYDNSQESYIFSSYIGSTDFESTLSLNMATNDQNVFQYLSNFYESVWDKSNNVNIEWDI